MDLSELIKCYNMEHKSLFTAFAVSFPVLFTVLYNKRVRAPFITTAYFIPI